MEIKRPLLLISNDDGYQAKGINSLVEMLADYGDIIVCAPESACSGMACAFSATTPLRLRLREKREGVEIWSCNGTPVDCVKMALAEIVPRKPDMVIGGINHGDNASVNVHYSGTMGVTLEGCMKYIPSVAFSLCDHQEDADFEPLRPLIRQITERVLEDGLPLGASGTTRSARRTRWRGPLPGLSTSPGAAVPAPWSWTSPRMRRWA